MYITINIDYLKKILRTSYYKVFGKIFSQNTYNQLHSDLGFPSVYCVCILLPLFNNKAALFLWQGRIDQGRNSKQRQRRKESGVRLHVSDEGDRCSGTLLENHKGCGKIQNHRNGLIKMSELVNKNPELVGPWWRTTLIPALGRQRQLDICEYEASLICKG